MSNNDFDPNSIKPFEKLINEAGMPSANILGKALGGLFGSILYFPAKLGIYTQAHLTDYERRINQKLEQIPEENKDTSKLGLLFKEIEDSKYQLDNNDLREMFAKLISATVDNRKNNIISPRYSLILSQLGSNDARFLNSIAGNNVIPCYRFLMQDRKDKSSSPLSPRYLGLNFNINNVISNDPALDILISFGIVNYSDDAFLTSDIATKFYKSINNNSEYIKTKNIYENEKNEVIISNNFLKFTKFGELFVKTIC